MATKNRKSTLKKYRVPILTEFYFVIVLMGDEAKIERYLSDYGIKNWQLDDTKRGLTYECLESINKNPIIVLLKDGRNNETLAHEAYHAVKHIADSCGIKDDEFIAYGIGAIMRIAGKDL